MESLARTKAPKSSSPGKARARPTPKCKICGDRTNLFDVVDFNKWCSGRPYNFGIAGIQVFYHRCEWCQFLFTDLLDDWTTQEIATYIYNDDYNLVDPGYQEVRPFDTAKAMAKLLDGTQALRILDYGSGSGKFAEHMRALGFASVENYDPFSKPCSAGGAVRLGHGF